MAVAPDAGQDAGVVIASAGDLLVLNRAEPPYLSRRIRGAVERRRRTHGLDATNLPRTGRAACRDDALVRAKPWLCR